MKRQKTITLDNETLESINPILERNGQKLSSVINQALKNFILKNSEVSHE